MSNQNYQELKIKLSTRKMMAYGYNAIRQMPKSEKHVLGADIRKSMHSVMSGVIACEKSYYKKTTLRDLDIALENLRVLVGIAHELKFISITSYENWSKHLFDVGNQVGGWIAWYKNQESNKKIRV